MSAPCPGCQAVGKGAVYLALPCLWGLERCLCAMPPACPTLPRFCVGVTLFLAGRCWGDAYQEHHCPAESPHRAHLSTDSTRHFGCCLFSTSVSGGWMWYLLMLFKYLSCIWLSLAAPFCKAKQTNPPNSALKVLHSPLRDLWGDLSHPSALFPWAFLI